MNTKVEWLGFSVARKHVYFYSLLIVGSIFANTMKDQIIGEDSETAAMSSQLRQLAEQAATFEGDSRY
jgi:hypothetical protein